MDLVRTLGVAIDPAAAKEGGRQASDAFKGVAVAATQMEKAERGAEKQTATTGATMQRTARAGDVLRDTLQRQNTILGAVHMAVDKLTAALNRDDVALRHVSTGVARAGAAMTSTSLQAKNLTLATDAAGKELGDVAVAANRAESAVRRAGDAMRNTSNHARNQARAGDGRFAGGGMAMPGWMRGGMAAFGITLSAAAGVAAARDVTLTANAVQRSGNALRFASDGAEDYARNLGFVRSTAKDLGLEVLSTQREFAKFMAAGKGTEFTGSELREVFTGVAKASAVLGLSADETAGTLNALQQMISKGTVQAEELRGQLGERLPGAFGMAARAMGVTTQELGKMLERGEVTAHQLLPALARELEKTFGPHASRAATSLNAEINRLSTAWTGFKTALFDSGIGEFFTNLITLVRKSLDEVSGFFTYLKNSGGGIMSFIAPGPVSAAQISTAIGARMGAGGAFGNPFPDTPAAPEEDKPRRIGEVNVTVNPSWAARFRKGVGDIPQINEAELRNQTFKLNGALDKWRVMGQETARSLTSGFSDFFTNIATGTMKATAAFKAMAASILSDIARIVATRAIAEPLANAVLSGIGYAGGVTVGSKVPTPTGHIGGTVGANLGLSHLRDPRLFDGAPRFHSGLAPDEFPAILQRGERVVPKNQAGAWGERGGDVNITVHVDGSRGGSPEQNQSLGSEIARQIEAMMDERIAVAAQPRGILHR